MGVPHQDIYIIEFNIGAYYKCIIKHLTQKLCYNIPTTDAVNLIDSCCCIDKVRPTSSPLLKDNI